MISQQGKKENFENSKKLLKLKMCCIFYNLLAQAENQVSNSLNIFDPWVSMCSLRRWLCHGNLFALVQPGNSGTSYGAITFEKATAQLFPAA